MVKRYENGSYKLQDVDGKIHKTRVNGWRLKPYFLRFEVGASSDQEDEGASIPSKQNWESNSDQEDEGASIPSKQNWE